MTVFWCESAWLTGGLARRVRLVTQDGLLKDVLVDADPEPDDIRLAGVTLPGMANAHSHAFHRALRGRVNGGGGNFWSWREQMYAAAEQLNASTTEISSSASHLAHAAEKLTGAVGGFRL